MVGVVGVVGVVGHVRDHPGPPTAGVSGLLAVVRQELPGAVTGHLTALVTGAVGSVETLAGVRPEAGGLQFHGKI